MGKVCTELHVTSTPQLDTYFHIPEWIMLEWAQA